MDHVERLVQLEYLGLGESDVAGLLNPFERRTPREKEEPHLHVLRLMRNPDYFYYTCKTLFNIELFPFQCVILKEMWTRRFPMLIGSRGMSKSYLLGLYAVMRALLKQGSKVVICGSGFRQAKTVFNYAENIWHSSPMLQSLMADSARSGPEHAADRWVLRLGDSTITALPVGDGCLSRYAAVTYVDRFGTIADNSTSSLVTNTTASVWGNGEFRLTDESYNNGVRPTKIVRTANGYWFEGTHNHRMRVVRQGSVDWVRSDEMAVGDRIMIDRSWRWHRGVTDVCPDDAYAVGLLVGDGCWTQPTHIGLATTDPSIAEAVDKLFRPRGWPLRWNGEKDPQHFRVATREANRWFKERFGLVGTYSHTKAIPTEIMRSGREVMSAFLSGLFDADGHVFVDASNGGTAVSVGFTNTSKRLVDEIQYILLHYGIISHVGSRDRNENWNTVYELLMSGPDAEKFAEHINFRLARKRDALNSGISAKTRSWPIGDTIPDVQEAMVAVSKQNRIRRGLGTAETTAVSASKVAKRKGITHDFAQRFLDVFGHLGDSRLDTLRELADQDVYYDEIVSIEDGECETYDIHVPDGHEYCANGFFSHNTKIRGERANCIITDEFASIGAEIFETVISGFGVVNLNPVSQAKKAARRRVLKKLGVDESSDGREKNDADGNQILISGTAFWQFNHFYKYWQQWKTMIECRGDRDELRKRLGDSMDESLDWRDFMVIRFPYHLLPESYYDISQISRSRMTHHSGTFANEFEAVFSGDSKGFYRRSVIEACTTSKAAPVTPEVEGADPVWFNAVTRGNPTNSYVIGVDPAAEEDNFAIVVVEVHETHNRVVYCWTTNKQKFNARSKGHLVEDHTYYGYCARKIRDLLRAFACDDPLIALDAQGGGQNGVLEELHNPANMKQGEPPIWPITTDHSLSDGKERESDSRKGLHIVELVNFSDAKWTSGANHGMRKDLELKQLLFPQRDAVTIAEAFLKDQEEQRLFDTLEDCVDEIDELKEELSTISYTQTPGTLRDKWDTPEIKVAGSKKGRMRKDRYSALLMANFAARRMTRKFSAPEYQAHGGFADRINPGGRDAAMYDFAPDWFTQQSGGDYGDYGWASGDPV